MKRGVLCVIEPPAHVHDELKYQLAGLIVTTASPTLPAGYWAVLPSPYVKATFDWHDARGFLCRAGDRIEVALPEHWLRPIRGDHVPTDATTPTHTPALA